MGTPLHGLHPAPLSGADYSAVELLPADDAVVLLDQRLLPVEERYVVLRTWQEVAEAIRRLVVRGAPAIGIAGAYGMVLASRAGQVEEAAPVLASARPTAVNLAHGVGLIARAARESAGVGALAERARAYHRADVEACRAIGRAGAALLPDEAVVMTVCNAGALATGGYGTALGVVRAAHAAGKLREVIACETRPVLQGARLTAWELVKDGIPVTLITDGMPAHVMATRRVSAVVTGADRIARNGDVANKIGTYGLACLAGVHGVPFHVAAPWTTVDLACATGADIPIEQREPREVSHVGGTRVAPEGAAVYNPAFDVTPARLVGSIVTERGALAPAELDASGSRH